MNEFPLITIGLTCFNCEKTIERALKSAINQDWINKEIILIDDYSTDNSKNVLLKLKSLYPQVQIIYNTKNYGVSYNLNLIIKKAKGEFVTFFDGDDESRTDRTTKQYKRFLKYKMINPNSKVFVFLNRDIVPLDSDEIKSVRLGIGRVPPEPYGKIVAEKILAKRTVYDKFLWKNFCSGTFFPKRQYVSTKAKSPGITIEDYNNGLGAFGTGIFFSKISYIKDLNGWDENFRRHEDVDLIIRAAIEGYHFISVNESLMTQYITRPEHKNFTLTGHLSFDKQIYKKHHKFLKERFLYTASFFDLYATGFGLKGMVTFRRIFRLLAVFFRISHYLFKSRY